MREELTSLINLLLFSIASCSVAYLGLQLVLADYSIVGLVLVLAVMPISLYVLVVKPEVLK